MHFLQFSSPGADLGAEPPFCAFVRDPELLTLGIALGVAARLWDHHRQIASMVEGVAHREEAHSPLAYVQFICSIGTYGVSNPK